MSDIETILKLTGIVNIPSLWITIANVALLITNVVIMIVKKIKTVKTDKNVESGADNENQEEVKKKMNNETKKISVSFDIIKGTERKG